MPAATPKMTVKISDLSATGSSTAQRDAEDRLLVADLHVAPDEEEEQLAVAPAARAQSTPIQPLLRLDDQLAERRGSRRRLRGSAAAWKVVISETGILVVAETDISLDISIRIVGTPRPRRDQGSGPPAFTVTTQHRSPETAHENNTRAT